VFAGLAARKKPQARPSPLPVGAENIEEPRRQHSVAVLAALAVLDVDQHALAVDRPDLQARDFADPKPGRIGGRQRDTIAQSRDRLEEANDLVGIENRRKLVGLTAIDDPLERFLLTERDAVEEPQGASDLVDG
jgi:hypothetical protein